MSATDEMVTDFLVGGACGLAAAITYTLVETAKLNGVDPQA